MTWYIYMEQMTQELDINNYDLKALKKVFNHHAGCNNFLNQYTLLDVEESKKKVYLALMKKYNYQNEEYISKFVEEASNQLTSSLFLTKEGDTRNTQMVGVKDVIQDPRKLNPNYFQETFRIINIDSMYREKIWYSNYTYDSKTSTNMIVELNDTLDSVVSLELTSVCIPYTFYTIDENYGNNYFYVQDNTTTDAELQKVEISGGNYTNSTLIDAINDALNDLGLDISSNLNVITNKVDFVNQGTIDYTIIFYDYLDNDTNFSDTYSSVSSANTQSKVNNNLGWILGYRTLDSSNVCLEYTLGASATITAEALCFIPQTKYFVIVIDDLNKNQTNKGLVQISHDAKRFIRPTQYFMETDNSLNCIKNANFSSYVDDSSRTMTKNQLYSALQINNYGSDLNNKNSKMNANLINNVFGIVPFENKSLVWGQSMFTSDKNKFKRKYSGPVSIEKLAIKLLDDRGNVINLNGAEWSFSMISTHLYSL